MGGHVGHLGYRPADVAEDEAHRTPDRGVRLQSGDFVLEQLLPADGDAVRAAGRASIRLDPVELDVPVALRIGKGTFRKMRQNLGWAIGYNAIALPIAAGVFEPAFGLVLRPEIPALSMSGSSLLVATNALLLKRLKLPDNISPGPVPRAGRGRPGRGLSRRRSVV